MARSSAYVGVAIACATLPGLVHADPNVDALLERTDARRVVGLERSKLGLQRIDIRIRVYESR